MAADRLTELLGCRLVSPVREMMGGPEGRVPRADTEAARAVSPDGRAPSLREMLPGLESAGNCSVALHTCL